MNLNRRSFLSLTAVAATAAAVASCSSQQGGGSGSGSGAATITLWTHNGGNTEELAVVQRAVDDFNAANDVQISLQSFPQASYNDAIVAAAASGDLPDILDLDGPIMPNWAWSGYLTPLTVSSDVTDKMLETTIGRYNDEIYSLGPYDTSLCILARKSAITTTGARVPTIDDPWTKDEFDQVLKSLSGLSDYSYAIDMGVWDASEWWPYAYAPIMQSFGGDLIDRTSYSTADGFLNSAQAIEFGAWFQNLFSSGLSSKTPSTDGQDFLQSKTPMVYTGGWKVLQAIDAFGADEVLVLPPVDFGKGAKVGGGSWQWGVSSSSANPEAASAFIEHLLQEKYLVAYSDATGVFPTFESILDKTENYGEGKPLQPIFEIAKKYALLRPATPGYSTISSVYDKALRNIESGADVTTELNQAVKDIDADISANDGYAAK